MATDQEKAERMRNLALSGGISGLILGAGTAAFGPFKKWADLAKAAGVGTGMGAGLAFGSGYVGDELLGEPEITESNPYTKRGALGGAALGAGLGGVAGGAIGAGAIGTGLGKSLANRFLPDNLITQKIVEAARKGGLKRGGKLGLVGAGIGALGLGYQGLDEGMQMDVIENERRKKLLRELGI